MSLFPGYQLRPEYCGNYIMLFSSNLALGVLNKTAEPASTVRAVYAGELNADSLVAQLNRQIEARRSMATSSGAFRGLMKARGRGK